MGGPFIIYCFLFWQAHGTKSCAKPLDFEVRRVRDNVQVDDQNFQNFQEFNKEKGFKCVNDEQARGVVCDNYKIRFLCPRKSTTFYFHLLVVNISAILRLYFSDFDDL